MKKLGVLAVLFCLFSHEAGAFLLTPYVGADYNYGKLNFGSKTEDMYADKLGALGVAAGVKVLSMVSVEGFYQRSENKENSSRNFFVDGDAVKTKLQLESYGVDLVGDVLNLGVVEVLSSIGYGYYTADVSRFVTVNGTTGHKNYTEEGNGLRFGLGGQVNPTPSIGVRAMFRYTVTDMDAVKNMQEFTVGLRYYF